MVLPQDDGHAARASKAAVDEASGPGATRKLPAAAEPMAVDEAVEMGAAEAAREDGPQEEGNGNGGPADEPKAEWTVPLPVYALECDRIPFDLIHGNAEDGPCAFHKARSCVKLDAEAAAAAAARSSCPQAMPASRRRLRAARLTPHRAPFPFSAVRSVLALASGDEIARGGAREPVLPAVLRGGRARQGRRSRRVNILLS